MQITRTDAMPTNQVMAVFAHSTLSFVLSDGATFADLADRLNQLGEGHGGHPTAIYYTSSLSRQPIVHLQSGL